MDASGSNIHDIVGSRAAKLSICALHTVRLGYSNGASRILRMLWSPQRIDMHARVIFLRNAHCRNG